MKIIAPEHVAKYCYIDNDDKCYFDLAQQYKGDCSYVYKIKCTCGCKNFAVYKDKHPTIIAECNECKKKILIYDLANYPSSVKLNKDYALIKICDKSPIYVNYEYDDEYLFEEDVVFDVNDITWAKVFVITDNQLQIALDDETA